MGLRDVVASLVVLLAAVTFPPPSRHGSQPWHVPYRLAKVGCKVATSIEEFLGRQ